MTHAPLAETIFASFEFIPDPRAPNRRYRLDTILSVAIVGTLCGVNGFVQVERVARVKKDVIVKFIELPDGDVPTHDTICRRERRAGWGPGGRSRSPNSTATPI